MIIDKLGRSFQNLRVSLTAACNYACTYCVPNGKRLLASSDEMSGEDTIKAISLLIETAGIKKVRLTGGEPLLSNKFDLVASNQSIGTKRCLHNHKRATVTSQNKSNLRKRV